VVRISTDESPDLPGEPQLRACLKGRSLRSQLYHPDRLKYPMKRVGPRGEGRFQRISWDEALDAIAAALQRVLRRHGPDAVYIQYGTGDCGVIRGRESAQRLMNLLGGYLGYYHEYSSACVDGAAPFLTGYRDCSSYQTLLHSRLIILNGFNPAETVFETNSTYYLARAREAGARIVVIDPRLTETAATFADEWLPLKPGTDAALFVAMAHVMVTEQLCDQPFLDRYCVGFDEEHMPAGVPPGQSFKSYLLGVSDGISKSPDWAAAITGIDADRIRQLARDYARLKPAQLLQGLGPQRHAHGEESVRAGITLACMTGNLGALGGGWGGGEGARNLALPEAPRDQGRPGPALAGFPSFPTGVNPVKAQIPVFLWTDAIVRGAAMTAADGVRNGPLKSNIKFIFNLASNVLVNQHADVNRTTAILKDESLVEFIVVSDLFLTPSARFADVRLPGDHSLERYDIGVPWSGEKYILFGNQAVEPAFERRHDYWWISRVAERLGVGAQFTEGKTEQDWLRQLVAEARAQDPDFPSFEELSRTGCYRKPPEEYVAFASEIADPARHPFPTPSGKVEIFSRALYEMNHPEIPGVPHYLPPRTEEGGPRYPLQCIGPHTKRRTHSIYETNSWMEEAEPHAMWISREDARARRIREGDRVRVWNDRGALLIRAHVTGRIRPGVVAIPQGAWFSPGKDGVCRRGCINVLTSQQPTPLARGNAQHTIWVEVRKV
jgi:anaerobic dimethyl sulfoxide reductase subunit A